jgi:hypothetical protein
MNALGRCLAARDSRLPSLGMVWCGLFLYLIRLALVVIGQLPQAVLYGAAATALGLRPKYLREFEQFIFTRHNHTPMVAPAAARKASAVPE